MADDKAAPPIIIIKKKGGHGGHHGGAWKVAYADFVTAMMALFIVLWLLSNSEKVKKAVGGYHQDPTGNGKLMGSNMSGSGTGVSICVDDMEKLKEKLEEAMKTMPKFEQFKKNVQVIVTGEGLRVEMLENEKGMFFESGKPNPSDQGRELLAKLSEELGKLPNKLLVEGHTDAKPYASGTYTNWELSADRANSARRMMMESGVRADQVAQVRGFADQHLRTPKDPENPSNRRISVLMQYMTPPPGQEPPEEEKPSPGGEAVSAGLKQPHFRRF